MKKAVFYFTGFICFILLIFSASNFYDASPPENDFSPEDLRPVSYEKENGFYRLCTLWFAENADTDSDRVKTILKAHFQPLSKEGEEDKDQLEKAALLGSPEAKKLIANIMKREIPLPQCPLTFEKERPFQRCRYILAHKSEIYRFREKWSFVIKRFHKMTTATFMNDLRPLTVDQPVPDLTCWTNFVKMYASSSMLTALEGDWHTGITNLLLLIRFSHDYLRGSRGLTAFVLANASLSLSLEHLQQLLNHRACPKFVYEMVSQLLPTIDTDDLSCRNVILSEYLKTLASINERTIDSSSSSVKRQLRRLLFHPRRSGNYFYRHYSTCLDYDQTPPHRWQDPIRKKHTEMIRERTSGFFWWWRNPLGKHYYGTIAPSLGDYIEAIHEQRTMCQLLRVSIAIRLKFFNGGLRPEDIPELPELKQSNDPFSGQPFRWDDYAQTLYSVGRNRTDNGGDYRRDLVILCSLSL